LKASNEIAKRHLLECCSSERIYVLCESRSFTILWLSACVLCAFRTAGSQAYTHTVLVVIVGLYTLESMIHKVTVELNIIEGLVGVQLCTLFLLQICLTDGTGSTTFS